MVTSFESNGKTNVEYISCDALRDFVPFAEFKKCEKHLWRSVTFSNVTDPGLQLH